MIGVAIMNGYYTGKISSIDKQNGKVKVTFPQESDVVSSWLPLLAFEYNMPDIGDFVAVILDENDNGICFGKIYSNSQKPFSTEKYAKKIGNVSIIQKNNDFSIRFDNDSYINYSNGTITIKAKNVKIVQDEE
ncbi:MAG: hypothetical protein KHZ13_02120 [Firmicutes bacterium]|nr:hypothetical protein [Bacillota bacterium]